MKYDSIIIGGGLSGLVTGIKLAQRQKKVAIISTGQSALHFASGSFGLLGRTADGQTIERPADSMDTLPENHPYRRIGLERVIELADTVPSFFADADITLKGSSQANHFRLTPFGMCRPCWLTLSDFFTCNDKENHDIRTCLIVNFKGFLDFYPGYLTDGLAKAGVDCRTCTIEIEQLERLRHSASEMRAASIARQLTGDVLKKFADEINHHASGVDAVLIPAVIGIDNEEPLKQLRAMVNRPLYCIPTTPMSVCGLRVQKMLRRHFERLGGTYLLGDNVVAAHIGAGNRLESVETAALGSDLLESDNFVLATGGIFSRGIVAEPHRIYEPLLNVDVDAPSDRDKWFDSNFFAKQPYMSYGVVTDQSFHPVYQGNVVENLYAVGAILGGHDALNEGSGAGVAILSALHVADLILK